MDWNGFCRNLLRSDDDAGRGGQSGRIGRIVSDGGALRRIGGAVQSGRVVVDAGMVGRRRRDVVAVHLGGGSVQGRLVLRRSHLEFAVETRVDQTARRRSRWSSAAVRKQRSVVMVRRLLLGLQLRIAPDLVVLVAVGRVVGGSGGSGRRVGRMPVRRRISERLQRLQRLERSGVDMDDIAAKIIHCAIGDHHFTAYTTREEENICYNISKRMGWKNSSAGHLAVENKTTFKSCVKIARWCNK